MFRINSVKSVNNYYKPSFKSSQSQTNPQIEQLNDVKPDFAVKTPIAYSKTGEIDFPYNTKAHCYKLANGQKIIIVPQEGETVLRTYVNTGSMNEPDNIRGISHYIEHNLFNGSKGLEEGDFFNQVNKMGASTNASTGFAETNYYISSNLLNDGDLENKIKLHASMLESPLFALEKLEKEKGIVNSEINMITSDPQNLAFNKMIKNLYGIKSTSSDLIGGTTDNITNLNRNDVINYFNNNYYPANMVTVITGDVDPESVIKIISKNFTSKKFPPKERYNETLTPTNKAVREDIISDKATASTVVIGFNGPTVENTKDRIYTEAISTLLTESMSSRINNKLRKLNSQASSETERISTNTKNGNPLIFVADSNEENCEKVIKTIFNEIGNIKNNPPSEQEMKIIKKSMLKSFANILEDSYATNNIIGKSILENNQDYLKNFENIVNNMTTDDIVNTAKKYYDTEKVSLAVVHPASATEDSIKQNYKNAISFMGKATEVYNISKINEYNTKNNYRVITLNSKTNNIEMAYTLELKDRIDASPAARRILTEILNRGSAFRQQESMDTDLAQDGIIRGFSANNKNITCIIGCDTESLNKAFSSLAETIYNPRFTQEEFEKVKSLIKDSIETSEKSAYDKLDYELYKGLPRGESKEEILEDLNKITIEDVKNLYNKIVKNGSGKITIAAPFDRMPELKNNVFNNIMTLPNVKEFKIQENNTDFNSIEEVKVLTDTDFKNQAEIVEAYKFKINNNVKDDAAIKLLNIILGGNPSSRLFMDLREKEKLAYNVKSTYSDYNDIGVIYLKIGTTTDNKETGEKHFDNVQKSIDGFNKHIEQIKKEKVSEEELKNAKLNLKNSILNQNHNSADKVTTLQQTVSSQYGIDKMNQLFKIIDTVTTDDIKNTANYIFNNKPTYSILATEDTLNANKEYLASLKMDS